MNADESPSMREYIGFIWIDDKPGIRLRLLATSSAEAKSLVIEEYGDGHFISVWNEQDADAPR